VTDPALSTPSPADRLGLTDLLAQMGAVLLSTETISTTVELVTALAAETIPGSHGAGVTLVDQRGVRSIASSEPLVEQADALQYALDSGPCLTSWREEVVVRMDDVAADGRWPEWAAAVADVGVRAMLSVPLLAAGTSIGAIKVYATEPEAFDARAEHVLQLFARQAAILLANAQTLADARRTNDQLTDALETRDVIGQAKGILLARGAADDESAFALLVTESQRTNTKLHEVARRLVRSVAAGNDGDGRSPVPETPDV